LHGRDLQNGGPAALGREDIHRRAPRRRCQQSPVVARDAIANLCADRGAVREQRRQRLLHGRRDRQVGVADQLEAIEGRLHEIVGTGRDDPAQLQLRQAEAFRQAAEPECQGLALREDGARARQVRIEHVLGKDLVANEGQSMSLAMRRQRIQFGTFQVRAGRVVGVDDDHGTRPLGRRAFESVNVQGPFPVVIEAVRPHLDGVEGRQVLEERVARHRHEHLVAGIAQQLEEE
jgi:hypothetical protein